MKKIIVTILSTSLFSVFAGELKHGSIDIKYSVEKAEEWDELFKRNSGWSGADGIFSYFDVESKKRLFVFSDTWLGEVDPETRQRKTMKMINNSMAVLKGEKPQPQEMEFYWNKKDDSSSFTPHFEKGWYWLQDGFIYKGNFYNFPMRVVKNPEGAEGFQFQTAAVDMLKIPLIEGMPQISQAKEMQVGLFTKQDGHELFYGAGVLKNATDGYLYIYGRLHKDFQVQLVVARIKPENVEDKNAYTFWDGKSWHSDINKSASLGEGGPELSVTRIEQGYLKEKYILCSMPVGREVFIRIGDSPVGPFGPRQVIYKTPEPDEIKDIYTYNAKAHPVLSGEDELLISYNVNTPKLGDHSNAEIYRPRFILLKLFK